MPTTYTNGLKLPDLGSIDWYNSYKNNIDILDPIVGTVNGVATTYAPISHNHSASEITSGTIDIARLPPAALERMHIVADQTARYALTTSTVQEGDTVKQTDTGVMYLVVDSTKLNSADGYTEYSAGTASKAIADEDGTSIKTGYGKLAGNNTWTGSNTFNGIKSTGVVRVEKSSGDTEFEIVNGEVDATTNTLSRQDDIRFYDKNTKITGGLRLTYTTDTGTKIELYARSWKADGTASYNRSLTIYTNGQTGEYYTTLETNFLPKNTNTYSLGSSSYQWSSVYAQTYYYNGTAWGLDQANVWSGSNTFTAPLIKGYASIINDSMTLGTVPSSTLYNGYWFKGSTNDPIASTDIEWTPNGTASIVTRLTRNTSGASRELAYGFGLPQTGNGIFRVYGDCLPGSTNTDDLGTSTNKWKTLNGVNPGALSLPNIDYSNSNHWIDIRGDIINQTGGDNWFYPSVDGWVFVITHGNPVSLNVLILGAAGTGKLIAGASGVLETSSGAMWVSCPAPAGSRVRIRADNGSTGALEAAWFITCQGNV